MSFPAVEFKYVTEEHLREWSSTSLGTHSPQVEVNPSRFMYELCWAVVRGDMPRNKCKVALDSVEFAENYIKEDSASILADTIAHMGQEITLPGERRTRLIELAKWVVDSGLAPLRILQERCEAEFLWEAEMIKIKASDLKGKEVRVNTRLLYQQTKFNLLREESEGYAKLVTLLCQQGSDGSIETVISTMKSLIGHFDLDPNRVLDIVLECHEMQPENSKFLELVPLFPRSHICHILGFKFQYYQRSDVNSCVPTSLYMLAAILIKANLVDLDSLYEHLSPQDEASFEQHEEFSRKRVEEANKIGKINLAATGKDLMEEEKPGDVTIDLYAALDMEQEALLESSKEFLTNQKLGLLNGFLLIDDWPHVYIMLERLAPLNPAAHMQICNGLFRALEKSIASAHALVRPPYLAKLESSAHDGDTSRGGEQSAHVELQNEVFQMLASIGSYLYRDALLLQKVCRVLRGYYLSALALSSNQPGSRRIKDISQTEEKDPKLAIKEARMNIEEALGTCLLPALQMLPANPAIGLEIWGVMGLLPYEARYRLYGEWEKEDERLPMLLIARQIAKLDTRRILKRLAKDNLKQLGRMVAKIAHANPMTVLRTIVQQIEAYKDMITPVVDAFKYLTQLEYDVLEYVVIERLAYGGREKVKEDGLNVSDWLQSLASFWGHLCKKYPSMELRGLFQYLVNQLKKGQGTELVVLQELIQQMANIEYTENMTDEQLEALAGGETLRFQATSFGVSRNNKALLKSTNRLKDALIPKDEPKLVVPLLLLIAQHRSSIIINADAPYIKIVSEQFDRCHGTLLQYVEFLISAISPATSYAELIPSLDDLIHKYHLEPEVSFLIYRPVMRLLKSFRGSNGALPMDTSKDVLQTDGCKESGLPIVTNNLVLDLGAGKVTTTWPDFVKTVHMVLPPKAWNSLSPELYATFWGLTLHDLYVPRKRYETEIAKQHAALKAQEESADNSHAGVTKRKKDKEKVQEIIDRLQSEMQKQEENVTTVHQRLAKEKDTWLTSCPDSLKINMEFLQRCIFPRCVFSMLDAIYCARFVHMMHSLGTPFFNTVNHIDVLICKTLQPLIHCCTEYEAGRLGRFLYETLKMAYYWKSDEAIYERECGNMPGFAVLYRDPNSARVTFGQFVKVHWKWSTRITKLLIQCLESSEYMEIRNALTVLFKISSVFPVTRKSGVNLEKRVSKIKGDEREDLKVLAIGVSAALAVRKSAWVSDEEFTVGYVDFNKCAATSAKTAPAKSFPPPENVGIDTTAKATTISIQPQSEVATVGAGKTGLNSSIQAAAVDTGPGKIAKQEQTHAPSKSIAPTIVKDSQATQAQAAQTELTKLASTASLRKVEEVGSQVSTVSLKDEDGNTKPTVNPAEPEGRSVHRRAGQGGVSEVLAVKPVKEVKDESRMGMSRGGTSTSSGPGEKESGTRGNEIPRMRATSIGIQSVVMNGSASTLGGPVKSTIGEKKGSLEAALKSQAITEQAMERNGLSKSSEPKITNERDLLKNEQSEASDRHSLSLKSPARDETEINNKPSEPAKEKVQKRSILSEDTDKINKRRRGGPNERSVEAGEVRMSEREKSADPRVSDRSRSVEQERVSHEERIFEKSVDRARDRAAGERVDREYRTVEKVADRYERLHAEDHTSERSIDRSMERYGKEKSVDRVSERTSLDRPSDRVREERGKEERSKSRYSDMVGDQSHGEDRFSMHGLPPPPPLPPNVVPQSLHTSRREDDEHRKTVKTASRMSPRREDKSEKRRSDEGSITSVDESKRRREEDSRDRKREDREILSIKADKEREKDKDKSSLLKEDESSSALSKRRRLKRDHLSSSELGSNFGPSPPPPPLLPLPPGATPQQYDSRDRDRKASSVVPRGVYAEDSPYEKGQATGSRIHSKETSKASRRDHDPVFDRDWEEDKTQRGGADIKRRHHRK